MVAVRADSAEPLFVEDSADGDYDSESSVSSYDDNEQGPASSSEAGPGPSAIGTLLPRVPPLPLSPPPVAAKPTPRVPLLGLRLPLTRDGPPAETPRQPAEMKKADLPASSRKPSGDGAPTAEVLPLKPPRLNLGSINGEPSPSPKQQASGRARDGGIPLTISLLSEAFQVGITPALRACASQRQGHLQVCLNHAEDNIGKA